VADGDFQTARQLLEKLARYAQNDDRARELTARIEQQAGEIPSADEPRAAGGATATVVRPPERAAFSMADELSFAWNLMEAKELTQDEYAAVVHDLAEMSATDNSTTISVLHALEFRTSKNLERIMAFLAGRCGMPIVTLSSFGLSVEAMTALPMDFMVRRGALVFGFIGPEALVVVMNPYNETLRKDIGAALGRKCHFFLAVPSDFDQTVGRIKNQLQEKISSENQG